jgi:hypothetical protein
MDPLELRSDITKTTKESELQKHQSEEEVTTLRRKQLQEAIRKIFHPDNKERKD